MNELEKKIYPDWAFSENQELKRDINLKIYDELKDKYSVSSSKEDADNEDFDIVFSVEYSYKRNIVTIHRNEANLSRTEVALLADGGNLCFGFTRNGIIEIFTD